jgi:hypothetical protein
MSHAGGQVIRAAGRCDGALRSMHCSPPADIRNAGVVDVEHDA